jgi:hypothetical protein
MSTLSIKNKFVKSEVMLSVDSTYGVMALFDAIDTALTGGATTGLTASDNLLDEASGGGITGAKLIDNSITAAKILDDAISAEDDFDDRAIQHRHFDLGDGSDPLHNDRMNLTPSDSTDAVKAFVLNNTDQATHKIVLAANVNGCELASGTGLTREVEITFADQNYFGDPEFSETPFVIFQFRSNATEGYWLPSSFRINGERIHTLTTSGFTYKLDYTKSTGGTHQGWIAWAAVGKRSLS